jgi:hypothetical protein
MMRLFSWVLFVIATVLAFSLPGNAALISVTGPNSLLGDPAAIISAPADITDSGAFNTAMQGFDELQDVVLPRDIMTDQGVIPAGTTVRSHMIFLKRANALVPSNNNQANVQWTFDGWVIGVMSDRHGSYELASTDVLGVTATTTYPTGTSYPGRGLKGNFGPSGPNDGYAISGNTLSVSMKVTQPGDWIRVVTSDVPVPSSIILFGTALVGLVGLRRKQLNNS